MKTASKARILAILIIALALPSLLSLLWHRLSGDPMMRPLGITQEALLEEAEEAGEALIIYAHVAWDPTDPSYTSPAAFSRALKNGFGAKGVKVVVKTTPADGGTAVTYQVGPSSIGPYPAARAVKGINAAVAAYRMSHPFEPK